MRGTVAEIESTIRRLQSHFERVEQPPPAAARALAAVREETPGLPQELRAFYALADGIRHRYLKMWSQALVHEFLPNGDRHPDARAPELSEWPWLGTPKRRHPWPLDLQWILDRDPGLTKLLAVDEVRGWLSKPINEREPFDLYRADNAAELCEGATVRLDGIDGFFDQYFEAKQVGQTLRFVVHEGPSWRLPRRIQDLEAMPFVWARVVKASSTDGVVEILARTTLGAWVRSLELEARLLVEVERVRSPDRDRARWGRLGLGR